MRWRNLAKIWPHRRKGPRRTAQHLAVRSGKLSTSDLLGEGREQRGSALRRKRSEIFRAHRHGRHGHAGGLRRPTAKVRSRSSHRPVKGQSNAAKTGQTAGELRRRARSFGRRLGYSDTEERSAEAQGRRTKANPLPQNGAWRGGGPIPQDAFRQYKHCASLAGL